MSNDNKAADKQIKVPADVHKKIKLLSVQENREMREIVETAFQFYMQHRSDDIQ